MTKADEIRTIKEKANRAFGRGNLDKALEGYQQLVKLQPKDMRQKLKLGDIYLKLKKKDEALKIYEEVAQFYTDDGFMIQAVSVYKMILQVDPKHTGMQEKIHEINQARGMPKAAALKTLAREEKEEKEEPEEVEVPVEEEAPRPEAGEQKMKFEETPLFSALGAEEFEKVVARFQVGRIPKGTQVIKEGSRGDSFFIMGSGEVRVYRTTPGGKKITLAKLGDGAFFGEMAFFLNSVRTASVETTVDTTLLRINRKDLGELMEQYPNVREVIQDLFKKRALDQLLKTMPLFASLEDEERRVLIDKFEMEECEIGTIILNEGEEGQYLYLIFKGETEVTTVHEEKGPMKLATLKEGDYFGEISLIQGRLNTADVTASKNCILFKLRKPVFKSLLQMHTPMVEEISRVIDARLKNTIDTLLG